MNPRFLLCDITGKVELTASGEGKLVRAPLECLYQTLESPPGIIVIRFPETPVWKREALMVLCAALKLNSLTKDTPALALLNTEHRSLLEDLRRARIDFVKYVGHDVVLTQELILSLIDGLCDDNLVERHVEVVCPFLHYTPIDPQQEMTVCGAYLDRMVLGGRRLHEVCKTEDHLRCEFFLNPRRRQ